jgi:hypothetical protein
MPNESFEKLQVDGEQIACGRIGHGRPLVVLNGFDATSADWDPSFIDRLASSNELVLLDNRGIGRSTDNGRPFDIAQLADDAARVIRCSVSSAKLARMVDGWFHCPDGSPCSTRAVLPNSSRYRPIPEEPTQILPQRRCGHNSSICLGRLMNRRVDCCHCFFRVTSRNPFIANSAIS